jgi:predicted lipoprotein with Yx(FWY)xxD motif
MVFLKKQTILPVTALLATLAFSACSGSGSGSSGTDVNNSQNVSMGQTAVATAYVNPCITPTYSAGTPNATWTAGINATAGATSTVGATGTATVGATSTATVPGSATTSATPYGTASIKSTEAALTATAEACAAATPGATVSSTVGGASTSSEGISVRSAAVKLNGKAATVLTDGRGMTLYYSKEDTARKSACLATCTTTWHPLVIGRHKLSKTTHLPGTLAIVKTEHGNQLAYNGHLLYTYARDLAAGQVNGANINANWSVATADLTKQN